jgi:Transcription factor WhiB
VSAREWRSSAACRELSGELFFPTATEGPTYQAQVALAKAVCAGCSVRVACLDEALGRIPDGIAGGLTPEERRRIRRPPAPATQARPQTETACSELEAAGQVLLAAGRPIREVTRRCGVSERAAACWAARAAPALTAGEGSHGGNRAPLQISHTPAPQPGT